MTRRSPPTPVSADVGRLGPRPIEVPRQLPCLAERAFIGKLVDLALEGYEAPPNTEPMEAEGQASAE
jgi:hypothetical protein